MEFFGRLQPSGQHFLALSRRLASSGLLALVTVYFASFFFMAEPAYAEKANVVGTDKKCVMCHRRLSFKEPPAEGEIRQVHIKTDEFIQSSHVDLRCQTCHQDIQRVPHRQDREQARSQQAPAGHRSHRTTRRRGRQVI